MAGSFVKASEAEAFVPPGHVGVITRRLITRPSAEAFEISLASFKPGGYAEPHADDCDQAYYIIQGRAVAWVGSQKREVEAGTLVYIPKSMVHKIENIGESELLLLVVSGPGHHPS
ncbi:MAG: cupin domain-containing protein [Nitrososphaerota archaeon]